MWKSSDILEMLPKMCGVDLIDEIIIINNEVSSTPVEDCLKHPKIKMHNSQTNLFVSPSWNLGAKLAKNPILCICQDDIIFDEKVFEKVDKLYETEPDVGIVGSLISYSTSSEYVDAYPKFYVDGSINFVPNREPDLKKRPPETGFGCFFFIKKSDWIDIPEEIKIFHGEIFLWNHYNERKDNYIITNFNIKTKWHTTWLKFAETNGLEFAEIQKNDQKICEEMKFKFTTAG
jgi:hypothetical protein